MKIKLLLIGIVGIFGLLTLMLTVSLSTVKAELSPDLTWSEYIHHVVLKFPWD